MGTMIKMNAGTEKIEEHVRAALRAAGARGGKVAEAATERLGAPVAVIDEAVAQRKAARDAEKAAWAMVKAEDEKADRAIGHIRDTMWNELGRPRHSVYLDQVFPDGVGTYTLGDVRDQPTLMHVLHARLLSASAPAWTPQQRTEWAAAVDALRVTLATAVEAHRPVAAQAAVAEATYRTAVRAALVGLKYFKRDLFNQGLTESQIHDIIPDATTPARASGTPKPSPAGPRGTPGMPSPSARDGATTPVPPVRSAG
jgi:hypothetical protein